MKKETGISIVILLLIWQIASILVANQYLVPSPILVMSIMLKQLVSFSFYSSCFSTILHMIEGLIPSLILALTIAFLGHYFKAVDSLFHPLFVMLKSVPTVSYVFLVLLLFGRSTTCAIVSFLVLFPIFYENIKKGIESLDPNLQMMMRIYPSPVKIQIFKIYLPNCKGYIDSAMKSALGLGFKVSVMAEILAQINTGIGRQLQIYKNGFDIPELIAWTLWIIIISYLMEYLYSIFSKEKKC